MNPIKSNIENKIKKLNIEINFDDNVKLQNIYFDYSYSISLLTFLSTLEINNTIIHSNWNNFPQIVMVGYFCEFCPLPQRLGVMRKIN